MPQNKIAAGNLYIFSTFVKEMNEHFKDSDRAVQST